MKRVELLDMLREVNGLIDILDPISIVFEEWAITLHCKALDDKENFLLDEGFEMRETICGTKIFEKDLITISLEEGEL